MSTDADISASTDLLGKSVTDLQADIEISDGAITGTLAYVDDYTGFSGDPAEQVGHYLALHHECEAADSVTVELSGSPRGPVELDEDGISVMRITSTAQKIKVTAKKEGYFDEVHEFSLTGLTLEPEE